MIGKKNLDMGIDWISTVIWSIIFYFEVYNIYQSKIWVIVRDKINK